MVASMDPLAEQTITMTPSRPSTVRAIFRSLLLAVAFFHPGLHASDLSDLLKSDAYVLLVRHAYAPGVGDPPGYSLERCETQRVLNDEGRRQSERMGLWLRRQGVERAAVYSSVWCRCQETARRLQLGPVKIEPALASFFDQPQQAAEQTARLQAFVAQMLRTKKDQALILVTHHVNIRDYLGPDVGSGDMVLARVDAKGKVLGYKVYPSP